MTELSRNGLVAVAITISLLSLIIGVAVGQYGYDAIQVLGNGFPGAPAFTISINDAGHYQAIDRNGAVAYTDNNDVALVITDCIESLGSGGGTIHIKGGYYHALTQINIDLDDYRHWCITGEQRSFDYPAGAGGDDPSLEIATIIKADMDEYLFNLTASAIGNYGWSICDIELLGMTQAEFNAGTYENGGLWIENGGWWELNHVYVTKFHYDLIHVEGDYGVARSRMYNCMVSDTKAGHGVYLKNLADSQIYDLEADCNVQPVNKAAVYVDSGVDCRFIGGHFEGWVGLWTFSPIEVIGVSMTWARSNNIRINFTSVTINNCLLQYSNVNDEYSGDASCGILNGELYNSFTRVNIGANTNADYAVWSFGSGSFIGCSLGKGARLNGADRLIDCDIWGGTLTGSSPNTLIGGILYSGATVTTSGTDYIRGVYQWSPTWAYLADTTP